MTATRKQTISCLVNSRPGALAAVAGSFAAKGINITSLAVGELDEAVTRMTIVVACPPELLSEVVNHLRQVPDVREVEDLDRGDMIERQLMLVRVRAQGEDIARIMQLVEVFRATVAGMGPRSLTLEMAGPESKVDAFANLLRPFGILEMARTGRVAMEHDEHADART
jgi:acetolactate synthase I/III small subunit